MRKVVLPFLASLVWLLSVWMCFGDGFRSVAVESKPDISIDTGASKAADFCSSGPACLQAGLDMGSGRRVASDPSLPEPASIVLLGTALIAVSRFFSRKYSGTQ